MNRWVIILLLLSFYYCYNEVVINSNKAVTGTVGKSISLKWELKFDEKLYTPELYTNNWNNLIIKDNGVITDEGEKLFGGRISRIWNTKPAYYYELTINNLSYSDSHIFQIEVVYKNGNGLHIKQDNTSSINLEVKGGVDKCGKQLDNTIEFGDDVSQTFHLCGNPQPKVSYQINNGETHVVPGTVVNEKTKKYQYNVNLAMKPFYCGKTIKYQFTGFKKDTREIKLIPKRVEGVRYELNATNCTTLEWEQVNYGTCYPDLKYRLTFVAYNGSIYQRETNMANQTTFVDCQDKSLQNASFVNVTAVHEIFSIIDHSGTATPTVTNSGTPKLKRMLITLSVPILLLLVIIVVVFCFDMFKTNQHVCNLFSKTSDRGKSERLNGKRMDKEEKVLQMENGTTGKSNAKGPKSPSMDEDSSFIDKSFLLI